jgi:sugar/nucleoside kinase (ribokinase family)
VRRPPRLLCLGNLTVDDVYLPDGSRRPGCVGGDALYATLAARLWEPETAMLAPVGSDLPDTARAALKSAGVDASSLPRRSAPTIRNQVHYAADGSRRWVLQTSQRDFDELSVQPADLPEWALGAPIILVSAMTLDAQEKCINFLRRKSRALIVLDLQESYILGNQRRILELVRNVDMFLPSEDEVRMLAESEDWEDLARQFARLGPHVVAIKFGARGSLVYERGPDTVTRIPARATKVIDTTGAGDAYCGGLLATYGRGPENLVRAARAGAVSAAFAVSDYGPDGLLAASPEQAQRALDDSSGWLPSSASH